MPDWLTARPVAHRGLHDASSGVIENNEAAFKAAIAGKINGEQVDLSAPLRDGDRVEIITEKSPEALELIRHSTSHLMAQAVKGLGQRLHLHEAAGDVDGAEQCDVGGHGVKGSLRCSWRGTAVRSERAAVSFGWNPKKRPDPADGSNIRGLASLSTPIRSRADHIAVMTSGVV